MRPADENSVKAKCGGAPYAVGAAAAICRRSYSAWLLRIRPVGQLDVPESGRPPARTTGARLAGGEECTGPKCRRGLSEDPRAKASRWPDWPPVDSTFRHVG